MESYIFWALPTMRYLALHLGYCHKKASEGACLAMGLEVYRTRPPCSALICDQVTCVSNVVSPSSLVGRVVPS